MMVDQMDRDQILAHFQEVSGLERVEQCQEILEEFNWNLEAAITSQLGRRDRTVSPPSSVTPRNQQSNNRTRNIVQPQHRGSLIARTLGFLGTFLSFRPRSISGWIFYVTTLPVRILLDTFSGALSLVSSFLLGEFRQAITNPGDEVAAYTQEFEEEYGAVRPVFFQGSYSQALDHAKKELMFLMVYLHCPDHQNTNRFCRRTLTNSLVVNYINENFVFWSCSVKKSEGYKTSAALRENSYPFIGIIVLRNNRMTVVGRIEDHLEPEQFVERVRKIVSDNEAFLIVARDERNERQLNRTIMREQDEAYQESLRADQEKEERKRKDKEERERLERELLDRQNVELKMQEELKRLRNSALLSLAEEPDASDPECIRVAVRLPNGRSIVRKFMRSHSLKYLYYFVFSNEDAPREFQLATSFPRRILPCKPEDGSPDPPSFSEAGLGRSEVLFVYDLES